MAAYKQNAVLDTVKANLIAADPSREELIKNTDFKVIDEFDDPRQAADFKVQENGRGLVRVKERLVDEGATWSLHNSIAHEIVHFEQSQDPALADFFLLHPNAVASAAMHFLMELDAYVKTQSLMEDLERGGVVSRKPNEKPNFAMTIDDFYQQIKAAGYDHETGEAQTVLFRSMMQGGDGAMASNYILPRLQIELETIHELQDTVSEKNISKGGLHLSNIAQFSSHIPDPVNTVLGHVKGKYFMGDDEGKTAFPPDMSLIEEVLKPVPRSLAMFEKLLNERNKGMAALKPFLASADANHMPEVSAVEKEEDLSWRKSIGPRSGRMME